MKSIICIIFICIQTTSLAFNDPDSLRILLNDPSTERTSRPDILTHLIEYYLQHHPDSAVKYTQKLEETAQNDDLEQWEARAFELYGRIEKRRGNYNAALPFYRKALDIYNSLNLRYNQAIILDEMGSVFSYLGDYIASFEHYKQAKEIYASQQKNVELAGLLLRFGINYHELSDYKKASEFYFNSLKLSEETGAVTTKGHCLNNLGMLFLHQDEYESALHYFKQALAQYRTLDLPADFSATMCNVGLAFKNLYQFDSAYHYYNKALTIQKKLEDVNRLAVTYINLGYIQYERHQYNKALEYYDLALDIRKKAGLKKGIVNALIAKAETYSRMGKCNISIQIAKESLEMSRSLNAWGEIAASAQILAQCYNAMRDYENAYQYLTLHKQYSDSSFTSAKSRQINNLRISYEAGQKEQEIKLLNQEKALQAAKLQQQSFYRNLIIVAFAVLSLLGFFIFRNYKLGQEKKQIRLSSALAQEKFEAERLQELDATKSRFFANIAHEFRTPLTLISGPAQQIESKTEDDAIKSSINLIQQNANKLLTLINQLLDLSKLESGMIKLRPERRDFVAFAKGAVFAFESLAHQKDIALTMQSSHDQLDVDFDPEQMAIIINNLVSNALKFTPAFGKINVLISVKAHDQLKMSVADNGIGIPLQKQPHIFDRFYQVNDAQTMDARGSGIGLALTKELVELHQGEIAVESREPEGTTFTVILPLRQKNSALPAEGILKENDVRPENGGYATNKLSADNIEILKGTGAASTETNTVLIVEDNDEVRNFIREALIPYYKIQEAENGNKGLASAIETIPDIIISDVMMPEKDGYELCRELKNDERTSHIPVILLTAKAEMENKLYGLETGADEYLAKPFNTAELLVRIKNLVRSRQMLQHKYSRQKLLPPKENEFITRLKKIIDENLTKEDLNMDELGRAIGMSRTQVFRKLKALTNLSTSLFIRNYRLEKALKILEETDSNVAETSYQVGFSTPAYFSTCFTEKYGYAPSEVKKTKS